MKTRLLCITCPHLFCTLVFFLCGFSRAMGADLSLAWDASISPNVAGYKIYFGNSSGKYGDPIEVGNQTSYTITGLTDGIHYFSVTAFDADGNESAYSNEVSRVIGSANQNPGRRTLTIPEFPIASVTGVQELESARDTMTGFALTNVGMQPAYLTFTALDGDGNPLSGPDIVNPIVWTLNPGAQFGLVDFQVFGEGFASSNSKGWIKLETESPGVAGFFLTFDSSQTFMDGVNFGTTPLAEFLFPEIEAEGCTRINIVNSNLEDAHVTINLVKADGTIRSSISKVIHANGALTSNVFQDLFYGIDPEPGDYVRMSSTRKVQPFQLMRKEAGDVSSLAGQDITGGATTLYSSQYVQGGSWLTTVSIINLDSRPGTVALRLVGEDGIQIGATREVSIPGNGKLYVDNPSFFASVEHDSFVEGYLEIVSDGVRLAGSTLFGDSRGRSLSSALPLIDRLQDSMLFSHVASNDLYWTGFAILNPGASDASVRIELYGADGNLIETGSQLVPAGQRDASLLTEYFPSLVGKSQMSGYVRLISNVPVASFAVFGTNNHSVLSAIPAQNVE